MTDQKLKDVKSRVKKAGAFVRSRAPYPPVSPELMKKAAERHGLSIGDDVAGDPTARAIFIASYVDTGIKHVKKTLDLACKAVASVVTVPAAESVATQAAA